MRRNSNNKSSDSTRAPWRILVVDDEEDIRGVIKKGLERQGYTVDASGDPESVLSNYKPGDYDLLLLDIRMPKMNGFELYRAIRKIDDKVKVCFITAFEIYFDEFRRVFPKLHVSCFVKKPVTMAVLARTISEELMRASVEQNREQEQQQVTAVPKHREP